MADEAPTGDDEADRNRIGSVYPILLTDLQHKLAIVVGGGPVSERKVAGLLTANARIRLIAPQATLALEQWSQAGRLEWLPRTYQVGDLAEAFLAFAATNQRAINTLVAREASTLRILCNVADVPEEGNFHVPALHRQGDFVVAVGSQRGKNPKRIKQLRDRIAQLLADFDTSS